jgi:hypothetical protein
MDDFKPYLEIVSKSGDRTRLFVYVLILINFCILAAVLNSIAPAWDGKRATALNSALLCITVEYKLDGCNAAIDYAELRDFDFHPKGTASDVNLQKDELKRQLKVTLDAYHKKDIDENAFNIPVFNVPLDVNDIWVLSGLFNCYLMYLLLVCFEREYYNLKLAEAHLLSRDDMELLLATQMLGRSPQKKPAYVLDKIFKISIILAPILLHSRVVWRYYSVFPILEDLVGKTYAILIMALCLLTLILLLYLGCRAFIKAIEIDRVVSNIEKQLQGANQKVKEAA